MKIAVIIPAAGLSRRFHARPGDGSALRSLGEGGSPPRRASAPANKVELDLCGKPVFLRSVELFLKRPAVAQILLAVNPDALEDFRFRWGDKLAFHGVTLVAGGRTERWETVLRALEKVEPDCTHAAIHDAARPLASAKLIDRLFAAAELFPAVLPGIPVNATLKRVADAAPPPQQADPLDAILGSAGKPVLRYQRVIETVPRRELIEVQTPQIFELALLRRAYAQITSGKITGDGITDDAGLVESLGATVTVVEGESTNFKVTRPEDFELAKAYVGAIEQAQAADLAKKRLFADDEE
jgi:2-C-methyl-D-erythritol 4-phosphate cytidylyltransferase